ncbi:MAG: hypothetical protein QOF70_6702 [Acetobacteraceae bacterium]|jgi:hypothetical protein|nr:hypothetical protein [Acetobacteraceae bacterium]
MAAKVATVQEEQMARIGRALRMARTATAPGSEIMKAIRTESQDETDVLAGQDKTELRAEMVGISFC